MISHSLAFDCFVPGRPVPLARPMVVAGRGGRARGVTPERSRDALGAVATAVRRALIARGLTAPLFAAGSPVRIDLTFVFADDKFDNDRCHVGKPDLTNLAKLVEDACIGLIYVDDAQITDLRARKRFASTGEGVHIRASSADETAP